jgi:large subunit ribosomal protein L1
VGNSGKRYTAAKALVKTEVYALRAALELLKELPAAKFDESVDIAMRLGVDPKHADQMVRGAIVLPHGTGKNKRVLVIASGEKIAEAQEAGADFVGGDDMVEKVAGGWMDFDAVAATPDMMRSVGKLGRILGPRSLMPNPKTGTVSFDIATAVRDIKAGKVEFKVDKAGALHGAVGRRSFDLEKLEENAMAFVGAVVKAKPPAAKGKYLCSVTVTTTMGPGIRLDGDALTLAVGRA